MIKKLTLGFVTLAILANVSYSASVTVVVLPGTMTNLMAFTSNQGSVTIKQFVMTSLVNTNSLAYIVDTPTNSLVFATPAYTNRVYYATNYVQTWTNFYGLVQSNNYVGATLLTNLQLIDITNNVVAAATNSYAIRAILAAPGGSSVIYGPQANNLNGYYFDNGIWATNAGASTAPCSITLTW